MYAVMISGTVSADGSCSNAGSPPSTSRRSMDRTIRGNRCCARTRSSACHGLSPTGMVPVSATVSPRSRTTCDRCMTPPSSAVPAHAAGRAVPGAVRGGLYIPRGDRERRMVAFADRSWGDITRWRWDFGDGAGSEEQNPVHVYEKPGEYIVVLTVSGPKGTSHWSTIWEVSFR